MNFKEGKILYQKGGVVKEMKKNNDVVLYLLRTSGLMIMIMIMKLESEMVI